MDMWDIIESPYSNQAVERPGVREFLMPSIGDALFIGIFLLSLNIGQTLLGDGDTAWHILTGENILRTFSVPLQDPYSHTMAGAPWTAHEWLAEVIMALFYQLMGLNGVVLVSVAIISLTFLLLYKFLIFRRVNPLAAIQLVVMAVLASRAHWHARPHLFSFLMTLAFFIVLELFQREGLNYLKFLPPLMIVWVNLHAGCIFGMVLLLTASDWVWISANAPLCRLLQSSKGWKLIYADGVANILVKNIPENQELIEKYRDVRALPSGWTAL